MLGGVALARRGLAPLAAAVRVRASAPWCAQPLRALPLASTAQRACATTTTPPPQATPEAPRSVKWWLYGVAGMVFGIVVVGGTTRLTNSGLSMVEWKPHGGLPPRTNDQWEEEFAKYKQFPEYKRLNPTMTVEEFKSIYFWEYSHRMLGRAIGVVYGLPLVYFLVRRRIPTHMRPQLLLGLAMGGAQGFLGWFMVKSGLDEATLVTPYPTVSPYRLAAHLTSAFAIYSLLLWNALSLSYPNTVALSPHVARFRGVASGVTALVCLTVVSGAFVAGLDAGLVYNEFPYMGESIVPVEWGERSPLWKNFTENSVAVQFNHRVLGTLTLASVCGLWVLARRVGVPARTQHLANLLVGMGGLQVSLGIATLLNHVPVDLGVMHQAGSLTLLTLAICLMHSLRRPRNLQKIATVVSAAKRST